MSLKKLENRRGTVYSVCCSRLGPRRDAELRFNCPRLEVLCVASLAKPNFFVHPIYTTSSRPRAMRDFDSPRQGNLKEPRPQIFRGTSARRSGIKKLIVD